MTMRAMLLTVALCAAASEAEQCQVIGGGVIPPCAAGQTCCGNYTMSPSCIDPVGDMKCCRHYAASTQCNSTAGETCCGGLGPGASSGAYCCKSGTTCCGGGSYDTSGVCCGEGSTCCAGLQLNSCCKPGQTCQRSGECK